MQLQSIGAASFADAFSTLVSSVSSALTRGGLALPSAPSAAPRPLSLITVIIQIAAPAAAGLITGREG